MVTSGRITFKISLHQLKHKSPIRRKKGNKINLKKENNYKKEENKCKEKKKRKKRRRKKRSWTTIPDTVRSTANATQYGQQQIQHSTVNSKYKPVRSTANTINSKPVNNKCTSVIIYILSDYNPRKYHIFQA